MSQRRSTEAIMMRFYEWWCNPAAAGDTQDFICPSVTWDSGLPGFGDSDMIWWVGQKPPWDNMSVVDSFVSEERGALVFEGVDTATGLRHRVSCLLEVRGTQVVRILQTGAVIEDKQRQR